MGGFDSKNKNKISANFLCMTCLLILREPVQLECGHRQCKSCIESTDGETVKCAQCQEESVKKEIVLDKGFKNDMQNLSIECFLCDWIGLFKEYENHLHNTHPRPVCESCDRIFESITTLDFHKQNECDQITVFCALKDYGCSDPVIRAQMSSHYMTEQHQKAIMTYASRLKIKASNHQHGINSDMDIDTPQPYNTTCVVPSTNVHSTMQLEDVYKTIDILAGGFQALNGDAQSLSDQSLRLNIQVEEFKNAFSTLQLSVEEQTIFLNGIKPNQQILQQDVASLKQKVDDMQYISYDGTLIWKITSFKEKMTDAQSERQTSVYSPPFYSSPTGYKMRARLYLYGDGNARRTHMSLFFVLMRSTNDEILKFPFDYKVTFCLYDQTPAQRHIIDSFRPDIRSNSFQRPRSEMNIASGIPKFFPLGMIQQEGNPYIRDDTMFIKVMVDFGNMPKTLLPYALSLNPGLPMYVQQRMIKEETERRAQQTSPAVNLLPQNKNN